jgi:SAM-dependent methyltransferase
MCHPHSVLFKQEIDSMAGWSNLESVDTIKVSRYFEYDTDSISLLSTWPDFIDRPSIHVLEVGAGTGFFTHILLEINPRISLTCLEPDDLFVETLRRRFGKRIHVVQSSLEESSLESEFFDAAISHIVIHNLPDILGALRKMKEAVRKGGHVTAIEPIMGGMHFYPTDEIAQAFSLLGEVRILRWRQRKEDLGLSEEWDPWNRCYPRLFEEAGLERIRCHGLTSVFTLSDARFSFSERKKWTRMRKRLLEDDRERISHDLLELGKARDDVDRAYIVAIGYLEQVERASKEELSHIHEQEVTNRIVTIGRTP